MKTWYQAVCDEHRERCNVMVNEPNCSQALLGEFGTEIRGWLERHYGCALRLVHRDLDGIEDYADWSPDRPWGRPERLREVRG